MARILRKRRSPAAIAIIVDGKDEKWYIEKVRQHYPCDKIRKIKIEPNLPSAKKINELFSLAKEKIEAHYNRVILFIDLDEPLLTLSKTGMANTCKPLPGNCLRGHDTPGLIKF